MCIALIKGNNKVSVVIKVFDVFVPLIPLILVSMVANNGVKYQVM